MAKLMLTRGYAGSGKSTWTEAEVRKSGGKIKNINKDDLRMMLHADTPWSKELEYDVVKTRDLLVKDFLSRGFDVIVSDTNLNPYNERKLREIAYPNHEVVVVSFLDVDVEECIRRDKLRADNPAEVSVGEKVIRDMHKQWTEHWQHKSTAIDLPEIVPVEFNSKLGDAIIVDMDGSLSHNYGHRSFYDYTKVDKDSIDDVVRRIVNMLSYFGDKVIVVSGRDDSCLKMTEDWLIDHEVKFDEIFMRQSGDMRKDWIVKLEIFNAHIRDRYNVGLALDDRSQCVDLWRQLGLKTFQVEPGDF